MYDEDLTDEHRVERGNGNGPDHVDQLTFRSLDGKWNDYGSSEPVRGPSIIPASTA